MPVGDAPITIDPYKSQVPLVQIPQEDLQRAQVMPEQAGYMGKAGAGLAIGDSLMKGMLKGLQIKEQRKYAQAQATINAHDAATQSAYDNYQTLLAQGKDEEAKAAYGVYLDAFNKGKEAKAQFAIPEKKGKGEKGKKDAKGAKDEKAAAGQQGGFAAGLKQFFERNPHVIPELALVAMQPKPPGPSVETIQNKATIKQQQQSEAEADIKLAEEKRKQAAEKTYDLYSGLNSDELAALPREVQQQFQSAKDVLFPPYLSKTTRQYISPDGKQREWYIPGMEPEGWNAVATGAQTKPGTESEYTAQALKGYGYTSENAPAPLLKYLHDNWQYKQAQTTTGSHEQLREDPLTHKVVAVQVGSSTTKGSKPPQPPQGFAPLGEDGLPMQQGGMTAPPQQAAPTKTATGKITAPPSAKTAAAKSTAKTAAGKGAITPPPTGVKGLRNTGLDSMHVAENTQKVENEKTTRYQKAEDAYRKAIAANQKAYQTAANSLLKAGQWNDATKKQQQDALDASNKKAAADLEAAKGEIGKWYQQQVHAVGGSVPEDMKVTLPDGRVITFPNKAAADSFKRDAGIQ